VIVPVTPVEINMIASDDVLQLYHERMAHQNKRYFKKVIEKEFGINVEVNNDVKHACMARLTSA